MAMDLKEYKQNVDSLLEAKHTVLLEQQSLNHKFAALEEEKRAVEEQRDSLRQELEEMNSPPKGGSSEQGLIRQRSLLSPSLDMQKRRQIELLKEKMKELHLDVDEDAIDRENQTQEKLVQESVEQKKKQKVRYKEEMEGAEGTVESTSGLKAVPWADQSDQKDTDKGSEETPVEPLGRGRFRQLSDSLLKSAKKRVKRDEEERLEAAQLKATTMSEPEEQSGGLATGVGETSTEKEADKKPDSSGKKTQGAKESIWNLLSRIDTLKSPPKEEAKKDY
jgi:hypothetical protein